MLRPRTRAPAQGTTEAPSVTVLTVTAGAATTTLVPPMPTTRVRTKSETIASARAAANPLFVSRAGATLVLMIPTIFNSAETRTLGTARELGSQSHPPTDLRRTIETRLRTAVHRDSTNLVDMLTDLAVATTTRATRRDVRAMLLAGLRRRRVVGRMRILTSSVTMSLKRGGGGSHVLWRGTRKYLDLEGADETSGISW